MTGLYVTCTVKAGREVQFEEIANELLAETRKEAGCIRYECGKVEGTERQYCFLELWESKEAQLFHMTTPHIQKAIPVFGEILEVGLEVKYVDLL